MKTTKKKITTLIATTLIATSAHGALCTFENLPTPTFAEYNTAETGFWIGAVGSYEGFNFTSSYAQSESGNQYSFLNNKWGYYDLVGGPGWGGYDEGIIGDRALFTPWGSLSPFDYRISRNELWTLNELEITAVWESLAVVIEGYRYGVGVFSYTAQLNQAQRTKLILSNAYPGLMPQITEIKVYSTPSYNPSSHLAIDNIEYSVVPAPSALALIGIAGLVGIVRRRR
jgi:hypothetical protein